MKQQTGRRMQFAELSVEKQCEWRCILAKRLKAVADEAALSGSHHTNVGRGRGSQSITCFQWRRELLRFRALRVLATLGTQDQLAPDATRQRFCETRRSLGPDRYRGA